MNGYSGLYFLKMASTFCILSANVYFGFSRKVIAPNLLDQFFGPWMIIGLDQKGDPGTKSFTTPTTVQFPSGFFTICPMGSFSLISVTADWVSKMAVESVG